MMRASNIPFTLLIGAVSLGIACSASPTSKAEQDVATELSSGDWMDGRHAQLDSSRHDFAADAKEVEVVTSDLAADTAGDVVESDAGSPIECPDGMTSLWGRCYHPSWLNGLVGSGEPGTGPTIPYNFVLSVSPAGEATGTGSFRAGMGVEGCGHHHNSGVLNKAFFAASGLENIKQIDANDSGGCVVSWDGKLACFGDRPNGGDKNYWERIELTKVDMGAASVDRLCSRGNAPSEIDVVLDSTGTIRVFGVVHDEAGESTQVSSDSALLIDVPEHPVDCVHDGELICILTGPGNIFCHIGPLVEGGTAQTAEWLQLPLPVGAKDLVSTGNLLMALTGYGTLYAWSTEDLVLTGEALAKQVYLDSPVTAVDASGRTFILEDGSVGEITKSIYQQFKEEGPVYVELSKVFGAESAVAVADGCYLGQDGTAFCWGDALSYLLPKWEGPVLIPTPVPDMPPSSHVAATWWGGCAATIGPPAEIWCWGADVPNPDEDDWVTAPFPFAENPFSKGTAELESSRVAHGQSSYCLSAQNGQAACWGTSYNGSLGVGSQNSYYDELMPLVWQAALSWIAVGDGNTCAGAMDGQTRCWGWLPWEDGNNSIWNDGVWVSFMHGAKAVHFQDDMLCYVSAIGEVWCAGNLSDGVLGPGQNESESLAKPQKVEGLSGVKKVSFDGHSAIALLEDGTAVTWGTGGCYSTGDGVVQHDVVVFIEPSIPETVVDIDQSVGSTCVLSINGNVYCWGWNAYGEAGVGTLSPVVEPTLINPDGVKFIAISGDFTHFVALDEDGIMWAWGDNQMGQSGFDHELWPQEPTPVLGPGA